MGRRDVITSGAFLLQFTMLDDRVLVDRYFGDGVGQVNAVIQTDVAFDNRDLCFALGDDQIARVGRCRTATASRNEQYMNWPFDFDAARDMDESAIANELSSSGSLRALLRLLVAASWPRDRCRA